MKTLSNVKVNILVRTTFTVNLISIAEIPELDNKKIRK